MEDKTQACHADRADVAERPNAALVALENALTIRRIQAGEFERSRDDAARMAEVRRDIAELEDAIRRLEGAA